MKVWMRLRKAFAGGLGLAGGGLLLGFLIAGLSPQWIVRWDPLAIDTNRRLQPPSAAHPFGTDELGRDVFSRTVHGSRISLGSAVVVVAVSGVVGTTLGLHAGYYGGRASEVVLRVADVFIAFPALIMAMGIVALLGPGLLNAMLAIIVIWWPQYVRLANGQVRAEREKPYVEAARAVGRSDAGILWRHILPNCWVPILIKGTLDVGVAILLTASLSFLGLGVKPPTPELGALVTQGRDHLLDAWWYSTFPGLAMFLAVFGFNLVGDSLRDALDPALSQG